MKKLILIILIVPSLIYPQKLSKEERQNKLDSIKNQETGVTNILYLSSKLLDPEKFTVTSKSITGIFSVEGKKKNDLFSVINKWISLNYNSANSVIQMNDKEAGILIVKGINSINYRHNYDANMWQLEPLQLRHTIEINTKDNRYRVIYTITESIGNRTVTAYYTSEPMTMGIDDRVFIQGIEFTGNNNDFLAQFRIDQEKWLKSAWVGKKRREKMLDNQELIFSEVNELLKQDIYYTMKNLENFVKKSGTIDDW